MNERCDNIKGWKEKVLKVNNMKGKSQKVSKSIKGTKIKKLN